MSAPMSTLLRKTGAAGAGTGPNMAPHSMLTEHLALTLNVLCGRVLRPGDTLESDVRYSSTTPAFASSLVKAARWCSEPLSRCS